MEKWTNQTAFTAAAKGMLSQMEKSVSEEGSDACMYRGCGGLKCGVGFLLPDELAVRADKEFDNGVEVVVKTIPEVADLFSEVDINLLVSIQGVHDGYDSHIYWEECLKKLAEDFDLEWEL